MADTSQVVVLGASMAGLLTARALSDGFQRVTLVERDALPVSAEIRKGVPQSAHAHGLLASGYRVMDAYFPGMMDELEEAGAPRGDVVGNFLWYLYGGWKYRHDSGLRGIAVSRPALEAAIRRRVKALPNVVTLEGYDIEHPVFDPVSQRVTGVLVRNRETGAEETLAAELVVDATGRGSQSPKWLEEWGFGRPPCETVKVDVGYATRVFERRPGDFNNSTGGIVGSTPPHGTRYGAVLAAESARWVVTLAGVVGDYPPTDEQGWNEWAKSLPVPDVYNLVTTNRPLSDIASYRFPANQRNRYERMRRFPEGYLVIGDAICSFNPIYGQGMSVAAMESKALSESLAGGLDGLAPRFFKKAAKIADIPWVIATGEDLRYPQVAGKRPPLHGLVNKYMERVQAAAVYDPQVCARFFQLTNLLAPPSSLFAPGVMRRVLLGRRPARLAVPSAPSEAATRP